MNNQKQVCKPQGGGTGKELGTAIFRQIFKKHGNQKQRYHTDKKQKQKIESQDQIFASSPLWDEQSQSCFFLALYAVKRKICKVRLQSFCRRIQHTKNTLRVSRFVFFNQETHQERYNELQHVAFSSWVVRHCAVGWTSILQENPSQQVPLRIFEMTTWQRDRKIRKSNSISLPKVLSVWMEAQPNPFHLHPVHPLHPHWFWWRPTRALELLGAHGRTVGVRLSKGWVLDGGSYCGVSSMSLKKLKKVNPGFLSRSLSSLLKTSRNILTHIVQKCSKWFPRESRIKKCCEAFWSRQEGWVTHLRRCRAAPLDCGPTFDLRLLRRIRRMRCIRRICTRSTFQDVSNVAGVVM